MLLPLCESTVYIFQDFVLCAFLCALTPNSKVHSTKVVADY